jgi:acetyl esterase/lipase
MPLWPDGAPGAVGEDDADKPTLAAYLPDTATATGTSVVLCPGGGYANVCVGHEGEAVAEWFRGFGVATFVLRYRIAPRYRHPAPLMDVQRAIRTVRARSAEWGVDPDRIGVMGFSAGGHLASTAGTLFDDAPAVATDSIDQESPRPDFLILGYPVITLKPTYAHGGSRGNLLGESPDPELVEQLSTELRVTDRTPPTFLMHTNADKGVPSENSVLFYLALRNAGVPAEMHIYADGPHGVGLAQDHPVLKGWPEQLRLWMGSLGLLEKE